MRKYEVLKAVVILQAVCMVVLTAVVVIKVWPDSEGHLGKNEHTNVGHEFADDNKPSHTPTGEDLVPVNEQQSAAKVGGDDITVSELEAQLYEQYGDAVLRVLMVRKAIDLEAAASELQVMPEELDREIHKMAEGYESEARFYEVMEEQLGMRREQVLEDVRYRLLLEKIAIRSVAVSEAEVSRYIAEHPEEFAARIQLHLQWILTETEAEADAVLQSLTAGEDFALLARTYSIDSFTADAGGDLGLIDSDDPFYDAELLDTASRLQVAEMAGPIEVEGGYAIIRLIERQTTTGLTGRRLHEEVRKQLALDRAESLSKLEDKLLAKYEAAVIER